MVAPPVGWPTVAERRWLACAAPGSAGAPACQAEQPLPGPPMVRWLDRRAPGRGQAGTEFPRLIAVLLVKLPCEPLVGTVRRARSGAHERHHGIRRLRIGGLRATGRWWLPVGLALVITDRPVWVRTRRVDSAPRSDRAGPSHCESQGQSAISLLPTALRPHMDDQGIARIDPNRTARTRLRPSVMTSSGTVWFIANKLLVARRLVRRSC